jgi:alpha-galactosidase
MKSHLKITILPTVAIAVLLLAPLSARTAPPDQAGVDPWWQSKFHGGAADLPFSFTLDGKPSAELLKAWRLERSTRKLDENRTQLTVTCTDPAGTLSTRCVAVRYRDFPVVEWTLYLKNIGKANTPLLEQVQGLDTRFERPAGGEFVLHGIRGDWCVAESYQPFALPLDPGVVKRFSPPTTGERGSGKPCDGREGWPYFNLQQPTGGVIIAVGWPGQWEASFVRDRGRGVRILAGQQLTHLYLKPGEEIRTPLVALLVWQGTDFVRGQNLWRSWYVAHNLPRIQGVPQAPASSIQVDGRVESLPAVKAYLEAGVRPVVCWRDAGWYSKTGGPYTGKMAWLNTGTWEPDPARYPHGFRPFSDTVRALGMQFLLWFEPERVGDPSSWLAKHPEWLLPGNSHGSVLNEGHPAARKWLIDHVDAMIKSQGLDWYREDLNGGGYATAWRRHDPVDRQGITENLHVQGHLALWDELRRRNPGLHIDSCASGGRRNDLETMRRAVPLLRSDFQFAHMKGVVEGNQCHTYGLSFWLPWQGSGVYSIDPYWVRSFLLPGFGVIPPPKWNQSAASRAAVKKAYDEWRRTAPLMLGDYYPLTGYSLASDVWMAWQFHRTDLGAGMVQVFRRPQSPYESARFKLHGLDPAARYEVENLDGGKETLTGRALVEQGLAVTARSQPAALVFVYKLVK